MTFLYLYFKHLIHLNSYSSYIHIYDDVTTLNFIFSLQNFSTVAAAYADGDDADDAVVQWLGRCAAEIWILCCPDLVIVILMSLWSIIPSQPLHISIIVPSMHERTGWGIRNEAKGMNINRVNPFHSYHFTRHDCLTDELCGLYSLWLPDCGRLIDLTIQEIERLTVCVPIS